MPGNENTISQIQVDDVTYNICDVAARQAFFFDGWHDLTLNTNVFRPWDSNTNNRPRYCRFGPFVSIVGAIEPIAANSGNESKIISTLDSNYWPLCSIMALQQASGSGHWLLTIDKSDGNIYFGRHTIGKNGVTTSDWDPLKLPSGSTNGTWLCMQVTYATANGGITS